MTEPPAPGRTRLSEGLIAAALALAGLALVGVALAGLVPFVRAIATGAPLATFSPSDARALRGGLAALSLALIFCGPRPRQPGRPGTAPDPRVMRWVGSWLSAGVIFALLALVADPITAVAVSRIMPGRGYRACATAPRWERHSESLWSRGGRCP